MARVLLLDDEALVRRAFARSLQSHEVIEVSTVQEAVQEIDAQPFDALLLDVHLYGGTSADLLDWLAAHHPGLLVRTSLLTGATLPGDLVLPQGVRVVGKPLGIHDLRALVEELVDQDG